MNGSFTVWNAATASATILEANHAKEMPSRACALPSDVNDPSQLTGWYSEQHRVSRRLVWRPANGDGVDPTEILFGVRWNFGGRYQSRGRFICGALAWAWVEKTTPGHSYKIDAEFGDPEPVGGFDVMKLRCTVTVEHSQGGQVVDSNAYAFHIQGDGAGWSEALS